MIPNLSPMVESWLASGISFPEARLVPASYRENRLLSDSQTATISAQITADVKAGVFIPEPQPWCTSPVFAVAKQGINQWRMVVDLRIVNDAFADRPFHYENLETVAQLVQYGDFVFTIDLKSAFQQLQLHPNMRRLFGIRWNGVSYVSTVLCFGWKSSPLVWTKLTREVVRLWRSQAIRLAVYLDDFIFMAKTKEAAEKLMIMAFKATASPKTPAPAAVMHEVANFEPSQYPLADALREWLLLSMFFYGLMRSKEAMNIQARYMLHPAVTRNYRTADAKPIWIYSNGRYSTGFWLQQWWHYDNITPGSMDGTAFTAIQAVTTHRHLRRTCRRRFPGGPVGRGSAIYSSRPVHSEPAVQQLCIMPASPSLPSSRLDCGKRST